MNIAHSWIIHTPIAHRGLHSSSSRIPENSIKAFEEAVLKGFAIELDIHLLRDNEVVVFHDDSLKRMCYVDIDINDLTVKDLKKYSLLNSNQPIPLLKEVFEFVNGQVPILIEIKSSERNKKIHKPLINLIKDYSGEVAIQSFNPFLLKWFVKYYPTILRGQLSSSFEDEQMNPIIKFLLRRYMFNFLSKPDFVAHQVEDLKKNPILQKLRSKQVPVLAWTLRNEDGYNIYKSYCDNIIFENFIP